MGGIPIFSVVAYSGTGKTTLLEKLIPLLKERGLRVAVVKQDAHRFQVDREGKDSWRLTRAGADVTAITSQERAVVMENRPLPLETFLDRIRDVDVILTEGYKHGDWPKILLHRRATGKPLPLAPEECIAVLTDEKLETCTPCYPLDDVETVAELICSRLPLFGQAGEGETKRC